MNRSDLNKIDKKMKDDFLLLVCNWIVKKETQEENAQPAPRTTTTLQRPQWSATTPLQIPQGSTTNNTPSNNNTASDNTTTNTTTNSATNINGDNTLDTLITKKFNILIKNNKKKTPVPPTMPCQMHSTPFRIFAHLLGKTHHSMFLSVHVAHYWIITVLLSNYLDFQSKASYWGTVMAQSNALSTRATVGSTHTFLRRDEVHTYRIIYPFSVFSLSVLFLSFLRTSMIQHSHSLRAHMSQRYSHMHHFGHDALLHTHTRRTCGSLFLWCVNPYPHVKHTGACLLCIFRPYQLSTSVRN